ncbi:Aste57867_10796 [Aphanomyces stellatus]|uniref:Aste57867_10796 protein n=1 Tax=Aphanomyces stellatus TaxID=120398 RepID=A0A485KR98_9STRA|nr:hypothetical protein As57867_010756 [Aphanomyces stellatus]VFT87665.1 Aste57867_10796 [Aphanomyces stellatus]
MFGFFKSNRQATSSKAEAVQAQQQGTSTKAVAHPRLSPIMRSSSSKSNGAAATYSRASSSLACPEKASVAYKLPDRTFEVDVV